MVTEKGVLPPTAFLTWIGTNPSSGKSVGASTLIWFLDATTANNGARVTFMVTVRPSNSVLGKALRLSRNPNCEPKILRIEPGAATGSGAKLAPLTTALTSGAPKVVTGNKTILLVKPPIWSTTGCVAAGRFPGTVKTTW